MSWGCTRCETVNDDDHSSCVVCGAPPPPPGTVVRRPLEAPATPKATDDADDRGATGSGLRGGGRRGVSGSLAGDRRERGAARRGPAGLRSTMGARRSDPDEAGPTPGPDQPVVPAVPLVTRRSAPPPEPPATAPKPLATSSRSLRGAAAPRSTSAPTPSRWSRSAKGSATGGARPGLLRALVVVAVLALVALALLTLI